MSVNTYIYRKLSSFPKDELNDYLINLFYKYREDKTSLCCDKVYVYPCERYAQLLSKLYSLESSHYVYNQDYFYKTFGSLDGCRQFWKDKQKEKEELKSAIDKWISETENYDLKTFADLSVKINPNNTSFAIYNDEIYFQIKEQEVLGKNYYLKVWSPSYKYISSYEEMKEFLETLPHIRLGIYNEEKDDIEYEYGLTSKLKNILYQTFANNDDIIIKFI